MFIQISMGLSSSLEIYGKSEKLHFRLWQEQSSCPIFMLYDIFPGSRVFSRLPATYDKYVVKKNALNILYY